METLNIIFVALGGAVSAFAVVAFLGQKLVSFWFGRELESYKGKVAKENNEALEKLKADIRAEERSVDLQLTMDRYRGPLVHSAYDLQSRIFNLVCQNVISLYFVNERGDASEKEYFIKNTMYVIAQYFAWTEIIRKEIQFIEFHESTVSKQLSALQDEIYSIWQSTEYKDSLSIWAGEQRGIGELILEEKDGCYKCIGYSKFLKIIADEKEPLLKQLESKVTSFLTSSNYNSARLVKLQNALIELLEFLDPKYIRFPKDKRSKIS
ncbi:hypothetical protein MT391_03575 [Vibrio sp. 1-Bac 57]